MALNFRTYAMFAAACAALWLAGCQTANLARQVAGYERTLDTYSQSDTTQTDVVASRPRTGATRR